MIILGYPGIGKSSISKNNVKYVDFDSSLFPKDGNWWINYVDKALDLNNQGYVVFMSTHKQVQEEVCKRGIAALVIYPSLCLHDFWIDKLKDRYKQSKEDSDYRALKRCVQNYAEDIIELEGLPFKKIVIDNENYDLTSIIEREMI